MNSPFTRRHFLRIASAGAVVSFGVSRVNFAQNSPNSKLNIGFVGVANRAAANLEEVAREKDWVNVAALCDVDANLLEVAAAKHPSARTYADFRRMLEQKDLDAVVVSTPDHTHAVACAGALKSGRHVYCEKPLTRTISECRAVRDLAARTKRVTQLGTQIHAGKNYRRVVELVQTGAIGTVSEVHVWVGATYGGMEKPTDTPPVPAGLDWDLWLGPVPFRPYHPQYAPFHWRHWWAFGGGSLADFGCHFMDLPHWALDLRHPTAAEPVDGLPVHPESAPPWAIVRFQYPSRLSSYSHQTLPPVTLTWYHGGKQPERLTGEPREYFKSGVLFVGEKGDLLADYTRHQLLPEKDFVDFKPPAPFIPDSIGHHKEWLAAIRTGGRTTCNFDYSGALTEAALLGNVAYRVGRRIEWDADRLIARNEPAANKFIQHEYRAGWSL
ncbi:MAG: Gfo/Idh/MocA family oxidoreductase [Verrucomicrobia bacterium]|nr:Gfo/Idh/MocA family oxidoreductase [Verrucomicrobiota bacterium]